MQPGRVAGELLEEHGGVDGSAGAAAGVDHVGDEGLDVVLVVVGAGQAPEAFAGIAKAVEELCPDLVIVGEDPGVEVAERDDAGTGEGGGVDEVSAAEGFGVVKAVGEDEAAFGVGVDDLDGLAGHGA